MQPGLSRARQGQELAVEDVLSATPCECLHLKVKGVVAPSRSHSAVLRLEDPNGTRGLGPQHGSDWQRQGSQCGCPYPVSLILSHALMVGDTQRPLWMAVYLVRSFFIRAILRYNLETIKFAP